MRRLLTLANGFGGLILLQVACGPQSSFDTAGPDAAAIAGLWWIMLALGTIVFVGVLALMAWALWRRRPEEEDPREREPVKTVIILGAVIPTAVLALLMGLMIDTMNRGSHRDEPQLTIEVIGHMFWWEVRYPEYGIVTANEIHVPVNQVVRLELSTADVIHSFAVPSVHGKMDMIPGQTNFLNIRVTRPGEFRGQCMEYCGIQHANMALLLIADPDFEEWAEAQSRPAREPVDPVAQRGRDIFFATSCVLCHAIRGTEATANVGPDLTHVATRRTLGAATIANHPQNLADWIEDPHDFKPGVRMPDTAVDAEDIEALVAYLESLQ